MAKAGRPKKDDAITHTVSVKFNNQDYDVLVEYCKNHGMTMSHLIRYGIQLQLEAEEKSLERLD
ncbi:MULTISPECIES: hypothetical protein [unclassified Butyrivibrio]|uniref:hypothetical protein n=1 Tax=unclassified Butyrivibrio TaxID=2639466 RepID=UPI00087657BE|nr:MULTISPECIES: hypothetical protein [unclassified Butyrivibrio]SCY14814.1 hypothetical protein SAMN02910371_01222 [Butyrivibrio sp. INlla14]SDB52187.1 hypothetical protein SAMN02910263_02638 [Butyrivibrio sp. INlla16]